MSETVLEGGSENRGLVVRIGNTVRRPRTEGHEVVEALLQHLESVEFSGAPRLLGVDLHNRQVLQFLDGEAHRNPPWQHDDAANAAELGRIATWLRDLHQATADFDPPNRCAPRRPLPLPGDVWTHGDVGYPNLVYCDTDLVGLIDWEFAAPADRCCDPAGLLAVSIRGPRPDATDNERRTQATRRALVAIASGYQMTDAEVRALPAMAASILDDTIVFLRESLGEPERRRMVWRADWLRDNADTLASI